MLLDIDIFLFSRVAYGKAMIQVRTLLLPSLVITDPEGLHLKSI